MVVRRKGGIFSYFFILLGCVVWLICSVICVDEWAGKWTVVWTRQSEILGTLFSSDSFIFDRRIPRGLWMGHCWIVCWSWSICQEQGSWGHSFFLTLLWKYFIRFHVSTNKTIHQVSLTWKILAFLTKHCRL